MEQKPTPKASDEAIEQIIKIFPNPFATSVFRLFNDKDACHKVFDSPELVGITEPITSLETRKLIMMFEAIDMLLQVISEKCEVAYPIAKALLMFEAGRRFEREQVSISELEKMMK